MSKPVHIATIHLPQPAGLAAALMLATAEVYPQAVLKTNEAGDQMYLMSGPEAEPVAAG